MTARTKLALRSREAGLDEPPGSMPVALITSASLLVIKEIFHQFLKVLFE
jgi:hypothetical protein